MIYHSKNKNKTNLTPKEKANELVELFKEILIIDGVYTKSDFDFNNIAENCARIVAVHVLIETKGHSEFWQKVLQEMCLKE